MTTTLAQTAKRTANHYVIMNSGVVHYAAADSQHRPYHVLACNGRSVTGAGTSLDGGLSAEGERSICRSCAKSVESGRIEVEGQTAIVRPSDAKLGVREGSTVGKSARYILSAIGHPGYSESFARQVLADMARTGRGAFPAIAAALGNGAAR